jgi:DNA-binding transcriptional regulator YdaS (Cro superfamily)
MLSAIDRAVEKVGSMQALANALGITLQAVWAWKRVPHLRVLDVERITGIPRHELRPDLYPPLACTTTPPSGTEGRRTAAAKSPLERPKVPAPRRGKGKARETDHPGVAKALTFAGSQNALGRKTGLNQSVISKLLTRRQTLTGDHAVAIERATDGAVSRSQLRPDLWPEGDKP